MKLIVAASTGSRIDEIARITRVAERVTEIQRIQSKLEAEIQSLGRDLDASAISPATTTAAKSTTATEAIGLAVRSSERRAYLIGPLAVEIEWAAVGLHFPKQTICERKASDTLRVLLENILARFGDETMEKLALLRVNRAPPLSRRPEVDFLNRKRGVSYQNQRVGNSSWHVLTHSSTNEKIEFVRQLAQALRFPPGALIAREIDVQQEIEKMLSLS